MKYENTVNIVNLSLMTGTVPSSFKTAVVKPQLKKPDPDPGSLNNYWKSLTFRTFQEY